MVSYPPALCSAKDSLSLSAQVLSKWGKNGVFLCSVTFTELTLCCWNYYNGHSLLHISGAWTVSHTALWAARPAPNEVIWQLVTTIKSILFYFKRVLLKKIEKAISSVSEVLLSPLLNLFLIATNFSSRSRRQRNEDLPSIGKQQNISGPAVKSQPSTILCIL